MGKGDQRTKRGKVSRGTSGKTRPDKQKVTRKRKEAGKKKKAE